jgi:hypothetical protein
MNINSYILKLSGGGIEIPEALDRKKDGTITVDFSIYSVALTDNQDGTENMIYRAKAFGSPMILQGDKQTKGQVKSRKSVAWRWKIESAGKDYDSTMGKMLEHADEILDYLDSL